MTRTLVDHDSIRQWAEEHGAQPARLQGTGGSADPGILRFEIPVEIEDGLDRISWDEWLRKFDATGLALVVEESEPQSSFNKFVKRPELDRPVAPAHTIKRVSRPTSGMARPPDSSRRRVP